MILPRDAAWDEADATSPKRLRIYTRFRWWFDSKQPGDGAGIRCGALRPVACALRPDEVRTAEGGLAFVVTIARRGEHRPCWVRIPAALEAKLLRMLETEGFQLRRLVPR